METKAIFGLLASLLTIGASIPYVFYIRKRSVQPHLLSWIGWGFITALGASAMMADGATWAAAILWANTLSCFTLAIFALWNKAGVWSTSKYDYIFFVFGVVGLILWQALNVPIIALICAIIADLFFGVPTIIKTYKNPSSESRIVWTFNFLAGIVGLFAVNNLSFHEFAYPAYLCLYDATVFLVVVTKI